MKTLKKSSLCALAALSLWACNEDTPTPTPVTTTPDPTLSITPSGTTISFVAAGETKIITVETNQESWNATLTPANGNDWLSITKNEDSFSLTATANNSLTAPQDVVIMVTAGDADPVTITASQAAFVPDPALSTNFDSVGEIVFEAVGHGQPVTVTTNQGAWDVTLTPADGNGWLTIESKGDNQFNLMAAKNSTPFERTPVTITVTSGQATPVTLTAKQQAGAPVLSTDPSSTITFLAVGGQNVVTVATNYDTWDAVLEPANGNGWLTLTKSIDRFTLTAVENEAQTAPTPVTVRVTAGQATPVVLTVQQDAADAPIVYYRVGDYYPDEANAVGVVWYIDPSSSTDGGVTGLHGKIIGIAQSSDFVELVDGSHDYTSVMTSRTDGKANTDAMIKLAQDNNWTLAPLGALQWCINQGEGWYIPAFEESRELFSVMSDVAYPTVKDSWADTSNMPDVSSGAAARTAFLKILEDKGSSKFYVTYSWWWTSTSPATGFVWQFGNWGGSGQTKGTGTAIKVWARAMKQF